MAFDDHTYKWIVRESLGSSRIKNEKDVLKVTAGYTAYRAMPATASTTAVVNAAALSALNLTTITTGITNPDVPRVLTVLTSNASGAGTAVVTGTNIEGKTISESFVLAGTSTVTGKQAFKTVTKVVVPVQTGAGFTISVGSSSTLGLNHRLESGQFTMRVVLDTTSAATSTDNQTFDSTPTVTANEQLVEFNTVLPVSTPNGSRWYRIYYAVWSWSLNNQESKEQYYTTTSTSSTSSSTSTTTLTTSTSSTSSSISSTSTSSTSTSLSTSSTSTSTSTLP
jgi:hypothetical protein